MGISTSLLLEDPELRLLVVVILSFGGMPCKRTPFPSLKPILHNPQIPNFNSLLAYPLKDLCVRPVGESKGEGLIYLCSEIWSQYKLEKILICHFCLKILYDFNNFTQRNGKWSEVWLFPTLNSPAARTASLLSS